MMFSPYWPYILLAVIILVLGTAVALYLVLRGARKRASAPPAGAPPKEAEIGFIEQGGGAGLGLKLSFARAMRALRGHVTRRDYRYRLPWLLLVGEEHSGKTTLLADSGMKLPLGRPAEQLHGVRQGVNWFFFDRGVVLDVAGEFVLRTDCESSNARAWAALARQLQKHRPERPIDGVVLTIPCTDLVGDRRLAPDQRARIEQKALCLYRKLWQAQKQLGMSFPVYVVVTKCDQVPGFQGFCRELPERMRGEMFGWSSPYTLETAYRPEWVSEAFQSVYRYLFQAQVELLAERGEVEDRDRIFLLPSEMQQLRAPLQLYLDQIFKESSFHDSFFFRGLYFCGDAGDDPAAPPALPPAADASAAAPPEEWLEASPDPFAPPPPALEAPQARRPAFVRDLFEKKVFLEDVLARPLDKVRLSRNRTALAAQVLSLAIPIVGCLGLLVTYAGHERRRDEVLHLLRQEEKDLREVKSAHEPRRGGPRLSDFYEGAYGQSSSLGPRVGGRAEALYADAALTQDAAPRPAAALAQGPAAAAPAPASQEMSDNEQNLLLAMSKVEAGSLYSVFIPSSWFSDVNARTRDSVVAAFKYVILDGLWHELNEKTASFLDARIQGRFESATAYPQAAPGGYAAPDSRARDVSPLYDQSYTPGDDGTLHGYIERFNELRAHRALYEGMSARGSGSLDNLLALAAYLGHGVPSDSFDTNNRLFRQALERAVGRPLDPPSDRAQAQVRAKVAEMIEELYQRSFEGQTSSVSYAYLSDIAQTEALLSRPEYTWLSTYVFDARSSFHGMALSSGLRELRLALEGLSRESFMAAGRPAAPLRARLPRRQMVWDGERLRHAAALCADYERFSAGHGDYSKQLDDSVRQAAHARLRANVTALVADAQRYQVVPPAAGQPAMLAGLEAEVRSLRAEQESLSQLLAATDRLGFDPGLRRAISAQVSELLGDVDEQFRAARLYATPNKDFAWWDGSKPVAAPTFGAANTDELAAYLEAQRKRLGHLARDLAAPLLNFASSHNVPVRSGGVPWGELLAALDAYEGKQPGNPLGTLEGFILVEMDKAEVGRCAELGGGPGASWSLDFFIRRRNSLLNSLRVRCAELAEARDVEARELAEARRLGSLSHYREIADRFNATLGGRFPFGEPLGRPYADARAEDVLAFFRLFDQKLPAARAALADNRERLGDEGAAAGDFLDRMEKVRLLFAAALEKKAAPALDFNLAFRVNREHEEGANQIADWTLDVGSTKYRYLDKQMDGRWVVGEPVRLTLRWANDSPVVPADPGASPEFRARDRVVVFEYRDRWALLSMLTRQRPAPSDFSPYGVDAEASTLRFTIPTRATGNLYNEQPDALRTSLARVFMRLTLAAPGAKEPLAWPFPAAAPQPYYTRPRTAESR
ncbi:MAG TPA: type VI secretion system protein [Pyrinomonadaceae bacterium]|nr:type VI secretion system protein [Pyrinomonadaceae bacterium]